LDQVVEQTAGNEITSDAIQRVGLRMIDHVMYEFLDQFKNRNSEKLITMIHEIGAGNRELLINFVEKLVQSMRTVLYIRYAPGLWKIAREDLATDQIELLQACSDHEIITPKILAHFLQVLDAMKQSTIPEIPVELAIIGILSTIQPVNQ
jgi:hypothetical protein